MYYLCRGLVSRGHEVTVVTSRSRPDLPEEEEVDGIRIRRTWLPSRTAAGWTAHALASVPTTRRCGREADIFHAQAFASILPCALARSGSSQPLISTIHTSHFLRLATRPWLRPGLKKLVEMTDYNLSASKEIADVAEGLVSFRRISVEPLANGVDTDFFRPSPPTLPESTGALRMVAPRRLFPKNGVEYLVRAVPPAPRQPVGGAGDRRGRTRAGNAWRPWRGSWAYRNESVSSEPGPHPEMPGILSSADLAVFPSLMEATSVGALEAMACQLPVAASDVGGLPEIVDDEVGTLFPPRDPQGLAAAVVDLVEAGGLEQKGALARQRVVQRWSNDRLVERHLEIYRDLLSKSRATGGHG